MQIFGLVCVVLALLASGSQAKLINNSNFSTARFPATFKFGVATAAYQIEGAVSEDGRGESMWDRWVHDQPNRTADGRNADVACDSYHKWREDIQLMKQLNVTLYRMSVSWGRILSDGTTSQINQKGIDFYVNFLKELLANNITPMVTLYHWDLPQHLFELGGWMNPQIADYFADYARIVFENLGPYVKLWATVNEPKSTCVNGYGTGSQAPGLKLIGDGVYQCAKIQLLAHAKAWHVYDKEFRATQKGKISIVVDSAWYEPNSTNSKDIEAAERQMQFSLGWYANPVFVGNWPQVMIDRVGNRSVRENLTHSRLPAFTPEEIQLVNGTHDFFAINSYSAYRAAWQDEYAISTPSLWNDVGTASFFDPAWPKSVSNWLVSYPPGVRKLLNFINDRYHPGEIYVTENGFSDHGTLNDTTRVAYLQGYLDNINRAINDDKVNVVGYTAWSLLDNFEWAMGYSERFGLIRVDFDSPNRTRTLKDSAKWYKKLASSYCILDKCSS